MGCKISWGGVCVLRTEAIIHYESFEELITYLWIRRVALNFWGRFLETLLYCTWITMRKSIANFS